MSEALFNAHAQGKVRAVAGRASDFYGPGDLLGERLFLVSCLGQDRQRPR